MQNATNLHVEFISFLAIAVITPYLYTAIRGA